MPQIQGKSLSTQAEVLCRQYCGQVKRRLPLSSDLRAHFLNQLEESVYLFLEENPDSDMEAIYSHFGTPESFASNILENLDGKQLCSQIHHNSWRRVVAWLVISIAIIYGLFYVTRLTVNWIFQPGYAIVGDAHELDGFIPDSPVL